jgi:hypothetical protein
MASELNAIDFPASSSRAHIFLAKRREARAWSSPRSGLFAAEDFDGVFDCGGRLDCEGGMSNVGR